jgi:hypothetical protein
MVVGFWLYGLATLHARALPRWCGVAFIAALPLGLALDILYDWVGSSLQAANKKPDDLGYFPVYFPPEHSIFKVFGLVWLALGFALWRRREAPTVRQSGRVR